MSLSIIKDTLEKLCYDIQYEIPDGMFSRLVKVRKEIIHSPQWIEKNAHMRLKACGALNNAELACSRGDHDDAAWLVNVAQGALEEAVRIDEEEHSKGVPKYLNAGHSTDAFSEWVESIGLDEDSEGYIQSSYLYEMYEQWMVEHAPDEEVLSLNAFGQRLSKDGFERTTKKVDGKAVKVWMVTCI